MKTFVSVYIPCFDQRYFNKVYSWISCLPDVEKVSFFVEKNCENEFSAFLESCKASDVCVSCKDKWSLLDILSALSSLPQGYDNVVFAWGDCPFYDSELTLNLYDQHVKYSAEYSYADGWPYGLVPEILASGTVRILSKLAYEKKDISCAKLKKESLFDLIKTDINSFEIETLISPVDYRMYKLEFTSSTKRGALLCDRLSAVTGKSARELCDEAVKSSSVLHTLPYFYSIQIAEKCSGNCIYCPYPEEYHKKYGKYPDEAGASSFMTMERFSELIDGIKAFSDDAVVALSLWGEPMYHPHIVDLIKKVLEYPSLSVLVETTGVNIDDSFCNAVKKVVEEAPERSCGYPPVMWIVSLDAVTQKTYETLHPGSEMSLEKASASAELLRKYFPDSTYVQMIRLEQNENELEAFFRSHDNRIIQKYDYFCGKLPQFKPADLSPVCRNECWHLRRDMQILSDGSVPLCKEYMFDTCVGNVFYESFETVWNKGIPLLESHIDKEYPDLCRKCDEFYTCNF
ncbi:MAG: spiro-SPASM protein [Treponemataceae bacterium]|nr:spiro-SPASM protein [Treponemataceae bacterium]